MPIITDTKKKLTAPIKIAVAIEAVAKVVAVKANILVMIAPTDVGIKQDSLMHWHSNFPLQNILKRTNSNPKIPKIKVTYNKVVILAINPA